MTFDPTPYKMGHKLRIVTATALFDGHDASINIMRRVLQNSGAEVIHLGHSRSAQSIVKAAIEEDAQGIAVSSYQGGHVEFFEYIIDLLKNQACSYIKLFGGGGGVILPDEIKKMESYGVAKIYTPDDGARLGLQGMINHMLEILDTSYHSQSKVSCEKLLSTSPADIAQVITAIEQKKISTRKINGILKRCIPKKRIPPVIGVTGTGGAGKSSLIDELVLRLLNDFDDVKIAILSCDPSRRRTGGALLGDRIRMNAIDNPRVYMRSLATRESDKEISSFLSDVLNVVKCSGFDLVITETAGIGQGDSHVTDLADISLYVMTSDFGATSQLEKINMLDYADIVIVNKFDKQGSEDAKKEVIRQLRHNKRSTLKDIPVYGAIASKFNDDGVTALYHGILDLLDQTAAFKMTSHSVRPASEIPVRPPAIIPRKRLNYLSEISETIQNYHHETRQQTNAVREVWHLEEVIKNTPEAAEGDGKTLPYLKTKLRKARSRLTQATRGALKEWQKIVADYSKPDLRYTVRDQCVKLPLTADSLSGISIPKIAQPTYDEPGAIYRFMREEHLPGYFPFTAGVFPLKRTDEDATRMFAGEGGPERTNRRFKLLSESSPSKRLSTAFDSPTLYGCDPENRPDIYGKVGTSGVSICTLDDMMVLYDGFDLCSPTTSVSMTINGPAPIILAMFLNTAIDQQIERYKQQHGKQPSPKTRQTIRTNTLQNIRGTVQADILKEDQGQNTCIFSTEFALKMMGDIQAYFIENSIRNFYSVSVSGYHIAEAGANPITQLAFTLANGFTYVEYYLSRGMQIDDFAPNFSFFFSNGMDPEYTVIGRVARRIWAIAMKHKYGASKRSQMLKYHVQTSGRSLHSRDIQFNDIRTTLQALCAIYDNCNSLHTNAFDEAITTPSPESVRRALAIQLIINREWGISKTENVYQGSFIFEELTKLVEEAVLAEFDRLSRRGGVLGAMETGYQRRKIQEESLEYETQKNSGKLPIIGVNTFRSKQKNEHARLELARATVKEKNAQLKRLEAFQKRHRKNAPKALQRLQAAALRGDNIFNELMETTRVCSLGQITSALFDVGGQYRRNM